MAQLLDPIYDKSGALAAKRCRKCLESLAIEMFYCRRDRRRKHVGYRSECKPCYSEIQAKIYERRDIERKSPQHRPKYILKDSRNSDRQRGMQNDLDLEWITEAIKTGCSYCGESSIQLTLDRIDNNKGHTKNNVKPSCIRCNMVRGAMPYKVWIVVAKGMRKCTKAGLFDGWTGSIQRQGKTRIHWPKEKPHGVPRVEKHGENVRSQKGGTDGTP